MPRKKESAEAETPISAMIDIVFLLIIFFVVTSAIDQDVDDARVALASAPHGKPLTKKDPRSFTINVLHDGSAHVGLMKVSDAEISSMLTAAAAKWGTDMPVIIRGDKNVQHEYIKKVMKSVTDTKLYRIKFDAEIGAYK
jgi:biopolymer transport protein ExbD